MRFEQLLHILRRGFTHMLGIVQIDMGKPDLLELRKHAIEVFVSRAEIRVDSRGQFQFEPSSCSGALHATAITAFIAPAFGSHCIPSFFKICHNILKIVINF